MSPTWTPKKFVFFYKKPSTNLAIMGFGPRCLLNASKNAPKTLQEAPRIAQELSRGIQTAFKKPPCRLQDGLEREGCFMPMPLDLELPASGTNCCLLVGVADFVVSETVHDAIQARSCNACALGFFFTARRRLGEV